MPPFGPGTYGNKKGRPPLPRTPNAPSIKATGMPPEIKKKLKEALEKSKKAAKKAATKAASEAAQKRKTKKTRKPKYNPYGPGRMNPTKASYGTGP